MSYYTTQYGSRAQHFMGEVAPLFLIAFSLAGVYYLTISNARKVDAIDTELTYHRHPQTGGAHTNVAVNSRLEPLYLSGAWF